MHLHHFLLNRCSFDRGNSITIKISSGSVPLALGVSSIPRDLRSPWALSMCVIPMITAGSGSLTLITISLSPASVVLILSVPLSGLLMSPAHDSSVGTCKTFQLSVLVDHNSFYLIWSVLESCSTALQVIWP